VRTPTEAPWDSPESHIGVAKRLQTEIPDSHILDQYKNPSNPLAHYEGTANEILEQTEGRLDMLVASVGTGGTIAGVGKRLKEVLPDIRIVGVDPVGSILAGPGEIGTYKVEGIGYDFIPDVLDRSVVDQWVKTRDRESFLTARRLIREEGVLAGGSSGATVWAALQAARDLGPEQRCVVILPDSVRNYMTKFMDDQWMRDSGFLEGAWVFTRVSELIGASPLRPICANPSLSARDAVRQLKEHGISQMPVVDDGGAVCGLVTENGLLQHLFEIEGSGNTPIADLLDDHYEEIAPDAPLGALQDVFERGHVALVTERGATGTGILAIVTKIDLLSHLMQKKESR
jgi:cystathionine beta-synthase